MGGLNALGFTRRELLLVLGGLLLLVVVLAAFEPELPGAASPLSPALSVHSSAPNGGRALGLWLDALGFDARSIELRPFAVDPATRALFLLAPTEELSDGHAAAVVSWVENGGELVLVAVQPNKLTERIGADVASGETLGEASARQPLLALRGGTVRVDAQARLTPTDPAWVDLLGGGDASVGAVRRLGRGRVYLFSTLAPFENDGLRQPAAADLVLALLDGLPDGAAVAFDEYHHGLTEHGTLTWRLLHDPWGWAVVYLAALVFGYAALRGRRFGPVAGRLLLPPRRAQREYVATVATMLRAGGHVEHLRRRYAAQLRRQLGRRLGVPPDQPVDAFAAALTARRPSADRLAEPLAQLEHDRRLDERAVLRLIRRTEQIKSEILGA